MKKSTRGRHGAARRGRNRRPAWSTGLKVTGNGTGIIAHAGAAALRLLADRTGLTAALSHAMGGDKNGRGHDRGRVLADAAVALADGIGTVRRMDLLAAQGGVFAGMASRPTRARVLGGEVTAERLQAVRAAMAAVRERVWAQAAARHGGIPAARMPGGDLGTVTVIRVDANFIGAYSRKEGAAKSKGRFGLFPLNAYCDNTGENLVTMLRPGNAGANNAADHIAVLTEAVFTQIPAAWRGDLLITTDGAGCTHKLAEWLHGLNRKPDGDDPGMRVEYSIGWMMDKNTGPAVASLPESAWQPMLLDDGTPGIPARLDAPSGPRTTGEVAEITRLLPYLKGWPEGLRVIVRRIKPLRDVSPKPLPGVAAQLELEGFSEAMAAAAAVTGWRYEVFATNSQNPGIAWLDARHRKHARVEGRIRCGKDTGAAALPFQGMAANAAWLACHAIASNLLAWMQLLACDPHLARAEPRTLQDRILHAPASLTRSSRRTWLNFPPDWPWTPDITAIFARIQAIPAPG